MLFHKNRNRQIPVYSIQQHLELKKPVKPVKNVASFIGKELAEDRLIKIFCKKLERQGATQKQLQMSGKQQNFLLCGWPMRVVDIQWPWIALNWFLF